MFGQSAQVKIGFTGVLLVIALLSLVVAQEIVPLGLPTGEVTLPATGGIGDDLGLLLNLKIASPLYGETISGTGVVILAVEPRDKITSSFFEVGGIRGDLSSSNNFSGEFDSKILGNGDYQFTATACINDSCKSETIPVKVFNASGKGEPEISQPPVQPPGGGPVPEVIPRTVKVRGSNVFSALTLFSPEGIVKGSGTDFFEIDRGTYNAQIDFFDSPLSALSLKEISLQKDGTIVETKQVETNNLEEPEEGLSWVQVHALKPNYLFSRGELVLLPPSASLYLFRCRDFDYEKEECRTGFEKVSQVTPHEKFTVPFDGEAKAFGFTGRKQKGGIGGSDQNVFVRPSVVKVADFNAVKPEEDLLGIDFEKMRGNLPQGLYSIWDNISMASSDEVTAPNFPYYSVEFNPFTGKKALVIDTVRYSAKWFESRPPATKLVSVEAGALHELYFEFYYPQGKDLDFDNLSVYLVEFSETEVMGISGDIVHFKDEGLLAGNQNFEIIYADIGSPAGIEKTLVADSSEKDSTLAADSAKKDSLGPASPFAGKKVAARFRASEGAKFMRVSFVFDKQEPSAMNSGNFYFDKIYLKKVMEK